MTREEARKAAEVMLAYANGKEIEFKDKDVGDNRFSRVLGASEFAWNDYDYRIKPQPTYRPFKDAEECWNEMQKHQPFGWVMHKTAITRDVINHLDLADDYVYIGESPAPFLMEDIFQYYTFADGSVFGIKEE